jgi:FkbM family methyltransferase
LVAGDLKMVYDLEHLKILPRYTEDSIHLMGLTFKFNDPQSFYHEFKNIFINEIYRFKSDIDCPVIIDAGGYVGISALYFKKNYPLAKIFVFEPDPKVFDLLEINIHANRLKDIALINAGVGQSNGISIFYPDGADGGNIYQATQGGSIEVKIERLSKYINADIDLLKINIEGMEGEVFEEIEHKLPLVKEIICEYHAYYNLPQNLGKILSCLDKNDFKFLVTSMPEVNRGNLLTVRGDYKCYNLIYAKKIL